MAALDYTKRALGDLDEIYSYVARDSVNRAGVVLDRILDRIEVLRAMPSAGCVREEFGANIRSIPSPPFVVFYRVLGDEARVQILRVIDGRRDLGTVFFD